MKVNERYKEEINEAIARMGVIQAIYDKYKIPERTQEEIWWLAFKSHRAIAQKKIILLVMGSITNEHDIQKLIAQVFQFADRDCSFLEAALSLWDRQQSKGAANE